MKSSCQLKLIDLLSLRPGTLLRVHAIRGEVSSLEAEAIALNYGWQWLVSKACFPGGDPQTIHNFSKLLDVSIDTRVVVRHPGGKVMEILRLEAGDWEALLSRAGHRADVLVDGRVIAEGEIVDNHGQSGILIKNVAGI
ncbi:MAG TPA: FliM/FliN family flagellar motor switch protein [bacterium]|mgnify:CR=1 FL=1|nr:hypothetical protein [Candidatus Omnitrophota bacterium]HOJ59815.1 FliM/FliN family flagellar motor switch protein [bacterium]HOL93497.1 FliM/FliN family flagellar motor switch protein [bacterium]HPP00892.1 FliM/FliN family flagellar motor switch protein [bacterium]HXK92550.1 FliM/FliN family flagellar motor switch protein [bacterium]